jgi:hypothetical protein
LEVLVLQSNAARAALPDDADLSWGQETDTMVLGALIGGACAFMVDFILRFPIEVFLFNVCPN